MRFRKMMTANSEQEIIELIMYKYHLTEAEAKENLASDRDKWTWQAVTISNGMDWKPGDPIL